MKSFVRVLLLLVGCLLFVSAAYAEVKFDYGADFRLRQEIWDNVVDLGTSQKDRNFLRLRSRVWGKADFTPDLGAYLRITNEAKWYGLGPYEQWKTNPNLDEVDPDELIFDNLYADAKNIGGLPIDIRIGRQDFLGTYGEGFLMLDGTPGDGSILLMVALPGAPVVEGVSTKPRIFPLPVWPVPTIWVPLVP